MERKKALLSKTKSEMVGELAIEDEKDFDNSIRVEGDEILVTEDSANFLSNGPSLNAEDKDYDDDDEYSIEDSRITVLFANDAEDTSLVIMG